MRVTGQFVESLEVPQPIPDLEVLLSTDKWRVTAITDHEGRFAITLPEAPASRPLLTCSGYVNAEPVFYSYRTHVRPVTSVTIGLIRRKTYPDGGELIDYLREVWGDRIEKWKHLPVPLHIGPEITGYSRAMVEQAAASWNVDDPPDYQEVAHEEDAAILICYAAQLPDGTPVPGGLFAWSLRDDGRYARFEHGRVYIHPHVPPLRIKEIVSHELGHALGMSGHSSSKEDLMAERPGFEQPLDAIIEYRDAYDLGLAMLGHNLKESTELLGRAIFLATTHLHDRQRAGAASTALARAYFRTDEFLACEEVLRRALPLMHDDLVLTSSAWDMIAMCMMRNRRRKEGVQAFRKARDAARRANDRSGLSSVYLNLGQCAAQHGRPRLARRFFTAAQAMLVGSEENAGQMAQYVAILIKNNLLLKDLKAAVQLIESHRPAFQQDPHELADLLVLIGRPLRDDAQIDRAIRYLTEALALYTRERNVSAQIEIASELAWLHRMASQWANAFAHLKQIEELLRGYKAADMHAIFCRELDNFVIASGCEQNRWQPDADWQRAMNTQSLAQQQAYENGLQQRQLKYREIALTYSARISTVQSRSDVD